MTLDDLIQSRRDPRREWMAVIGVAVGLVVIGVATRLAFEPLLEVAKPHRGGWRLI